MPKPKRLETRELAPNTDIVGPAVIQEQPRSWRDRPELEPDDVLTGVKAIHQYLCELIGRKQSLSTTYWQIARGMLPARKFGRFYIGSRRGIAQHLARGTGLAA